MIGLKWLFFYAISLCLWLAIHSLRPVNYLLIVPVLTSVFPVNVKFAKHTFLIMCQKFQVSLSGDCYLFLILFTTSPINTRSGDVVLTYRRSNQVCIASSLFFILCHISYYILVRYSFPLYLSLDTLLDFCKALGVILCAFTLLLHIFCFLLQCYKYTIHTQVFFIIFKQNVYPTYSSIFYYI